MSEAFVDGERIEVREGMLVLIESGQGHEIRDTGERPIQTLNVYSPPFGKLRRVAGKAGLSAPFTHSVLME